MFLAHPCYTIRHTRPLQHPHSPPGCDQWTDPLCQAVPSTLGMTLTHICYGQTMISIEVLWGPQALLRFRSGRSFLSVTLCPSDESVLASHPKAPEGQVLWTVIKHTTITTYTHSAHTGSSSLLTREMRFKYDDTVNHILWIWKCNPKILITHYVKICGILEMTFLLICFQVFLSWCSSLK